MHKQEHGFQLPSLEGPFREVNWTQAHRELLPQAQAWPERIFWGKHELPLLCSEPSANLSKPCTKRNREHGNATVVSHSGTSGELTGVCGVWEQRISPPSCLLSRWGGQLFVQQVHSTVLKPGLRLCWVAWGLIKYKPSGGNASRLWSLLGEVTVWLNCSKSFPTFGVSGSRSLEVKLLQVRAFPHFPFLPSMYPDVVSQHWKPEAWVCAGWVTVLQGTFRGKQLIV